MLLCCLRSEYPFISLCCCCYIIIMVCDTYLFLYYICVYLIEWIKKCASRATKLKPNNNSNKMQEARGEESKTKKKKKTQRETFVIYWCRICFSCGRTDHAMVELKVTTVSLNVCLCVCVFVLVHWESVVDVAFATFFACTWGTDCCTKKKSTTTTTATTNSELVARRHILLQFSFAVAAIFVIKCIL